MGRKKTTAAAEKYFDIKRILADNKAGFTNEYDCLCCSAEPWLGLSGPKQVAHLLGIKGQGIAACSQSSMKLSKDEINILAGSTEASRQWRDRGLGQSHPALSRSPTQSGGSSTQEAPKKRQLDMQDALLIEKK